MGVVTGVAAKLMDINKVQIRGATGLKLIDTINKAKAIRKKM